MLATSENLVETVAELSIRQVAVAVDLLAHSQKMVAYAVGIAKRFGATVYLVYVHAPPEALVEYTTEEFHDYLERERRDRERALEELCAKTRHAYPNCGAEFRVGNPADEILKLAQTLHVDLIITASHHTSFLGRLFDLDQGSKMMHRATCPVLIYHEPMQAFL
jgi:nucleotide-binding universal stress UspA family protein